jgi:flagellar assembly factor FliW
MSVAISVEPGILVETTRFGQIVVDEMQLVHLPDGLLGFEDLCDYCLLPHAPDSAFHWLQSLTVPSIAFVVVNPFDFFPDYEFTIDDETTAVLHLHDVMDVAVLTLVTIRGAEVTTNLVGPLVINTRKRCARQLVLSDSRYATRHSLLAARACAEEASV